MVSKEVWWLGDDVFQVVVGNKNIIFWANPNITGALDCRFSSELQFDVSLFPQTTQDEARS